jgi:MFS family permease
VARPQETGNGDFRRLWAASAVSSLGDGIRYAALPLLAARVTRDPQQVSLVMAAQGAAWLVFALPSGALADRWDRRRTMWVCDAIRCGLAAALAAAVATGFTSIPLLVAVAFALVATETLFYSAGQSALPVLVRPAELPRANSRIYATTVLGTGFVGPPAGAALFGIAASAPFGVDAVSFGLAALLATRLRTDLGPVPHPGPRRTLAAEIGEGTRWLWAHVELRMLVLMLTVWNIVEAGVFAVLVLWSLETLRMPEAGYGLLYAALAVGGVVGSVIAERVGRWLGLGRAMAVSAAATVFAFAGLGAASSPAAAIALMALFGLAAFVWNVLTAAFRQSVVPVGIQGRVSSVYRFATWGAVAIGAVLGGAATSALGQRAPFLLAALGLGVASVVFLPWLSNERLSLSAAGARELGPVLHRARTAGTAQQPVPG